MFTGIVTAIGRVVAIDEGLELRRIRVEAPSGWLAGTSIGDSISVDGACLTPVSVEGDVFEIEAVKSTLERTRVGGYGVGTAVNLEKALRVGDRLDGHWVQGHVDGVGRLEGVRVEGETRFVLVSLPEDVWDLTILHGSITLNGVSLTVNELEAPRVCEVAIIPHTWMHTNLSTLAEGDPVNVEGDLMGKYARRILAREPGTAASES